MIEEINIRNYKSFEDATLKLSPLTMLIGANASGKSNALEAIRFLNWLAGGARLYQLKTHINTTDRIFRGDTKDLLKRGKKEFGMSAVFIGTKKLAFEIGLELRRAELHIVSETLKIDGEANPLYEITNRSKGEHQNINITYNTYGRGRNPQVVGLDQLTVFSQLMSPTAFQQTHKKAIQIIPEACKTVENQLSNVLFLDPNPTMMRQSSHIDETNMTGDGRTLSSVLYHLLDTSTNVFYGETEIKNNTFEKTQNRKILLEIISSLPEQRIVDINFVKGSRNDVVLVLTEIYGNSEEKYDASLLSDGTLRVLAYAATLLSAKPGSMVIIEEFDNGIHPSRAQHLLKLFNDIAEERKLTLLLSSHNPAMLDALPDSAIPNAVFCHRDPTSGSSMLTKLSDLDFFSELVLQDSLGGLLTRGLIDKYAKSSETAEDRKKKALAFLHSLD